jgi:hypothetical protein
MHYPPRDGIIPELEAQELTDSGMLQRHAPASAAEVRAALASAPR